MACKDRLSRLLRYGRKNGGGWDDGECDCPENTCEMLDDSDVDRIVEGLSALAKVERLTAENARLHSAAEGVVAHMEGRQPMRGWLRDNNQSRDALNALAEVVQS